MVRLLTIPAKTLWVLLVSLLMVGTVPTAGFADVTSLEVDPVTGVYRGTADLTATITPAVEGLSISFSLAGNSAGSALTNASGVATINNADLGTIAADTYAAGVSADFDGDGTYDPSDDTAQLQVNKRQVTGSFTSPNRPYDGTTDADANNRQLSNDAGGAVSLVGGTASFGSAGVGDGKTVTLSGASLDGVEADNYDLTGVDTTTANITERGLTVVATAQDKPYDGNRTATVTLDDNRITGDALTLDYTSALFDTKEVGTNKTVTVTGIAITGGADAGNYNLLNTSDTDQASITDPVEITVTFTANDKVYDGTTAFTVDSYDLQGVNAGDNVSLTGGTKTFSSANVGPRTATWSGFSLSGADAGNYTLASTQATDTANITERSVTASFTADNKVYDGTMAATINTRNLSNAVGGDDVDVSGGSVTFGSEDVGSHTVTWTGFSLNGTKAGNYNLTNASATDAASITDRPVGVSFTTAATRPYDGTAAAAITGRTVSNVVATEDVVVDGGVATYNNKNVGVNKPVTASGFTLSGADTSNYTIGTVTPTSADITPLTVTGTFTANDKVYDATLVAGITSGSRQITGGVLPGETVTLTGGTASFATKDVGTAKVVTGSGFTLGGTGAINYVLQTLPTTTADITPRTVTGSFTAANKEYDGTTTATVSSSGVSGEVGGEVLGLSVTSASFATPTVGTNKPVTAGTSTLTGTGASNYTLGSVSNANANITQRLLTVNVATNPTKIYDGTTTATAAVTLEGDPVAGDDAQPTFTGATFENPEVGLQDVNITGISVAGTSAPNYRLAATTMTVPGEILPKGGVYVRFTAEDKIYNGTRRAYLAALVEPEIVGLQPEDVGDVHVEGDGLTFSNALADRGKKVTWNGLELHGVDAHRYTLATLPPTDRAAIFRRRLSVRARGEDKVWDGTTRAQVSLYARNKVSGDSLRLAYDNAEFGGPAVGRDKTITVTGIRVGGEDAANYRWNTRTKTTADIIKLVKRYRSDGLIKQAGRRFMGNDTYNTTADRQTKEVNARRGQNRVFYVKVQNDRVRHARRQPLRLEGCFPTRGFKVNYYRGRSSTQIGDYAIVDGDLTWVYRTPRLRPGRGFLVRMVLRPTNFAKIGAESGCAITALSTRIGTDRTRPTVDMVRARLTVIRRR